MKIADFVSDRPFPALSSPPPDLPEDGIEGVVAVVLQPRRDDRGALTELLTQRDPGTAPIVHVYHVWAEPGSVRAWVIHHRQTDRLVFAEGVFRLVLYDLRPDSPSHRRLSVIDTGAASPRRIHIPPFVAHGVQNRGTAGAGFFNLPTEVFDPARPDKARVAPDDPRIPYRF